MSDTVTLYPPGGGAGRKVLKGSVPRMTSAGWTEKDPDAKPAKKVDAKKKDD